MLINAYAKALEVSLKLIIIILLINLIFKIIPQQLCDNAGFDSTHMLNKLRKAHAEGEIWAGVDVQKEGVSNNYDKFVWEPALVKINALQAASEAASSVLSVC